MKISLTKELSSKQLEWRNHPSIHAWTRQNGLISPEEHYRWLDKLEKDPSIMMFGILNEKEEIGTAGFTSISYIHGTAEFSLFIGPEYQSRGYGKAALQELFKYGFNHLRLNLIYGETFETNPALKIFTDLGMSIEGHLRQRYFKNGSYMDTKVISITQKEAKEQRWFTS